MLYQNSNSRYHKIEFKKTGWFFLYKKIDFLYKQFDFLYKKIEYFGNKSKLRFFKYQEIILDIKKYFYIKKSIFWYKKYGINSETVPKNPKFFILKKSISWYQEIDLMI